MKGAGCNKTALVQLFFLSVLVTLIVLPNGPGPDSTSVSWAVARVIFMVHGLVLVKVVDPTVAEAPPAGILYVTDEDVEAVGTADWLIMTEAAAASPLAPRQSGPETKVVLPVRVIVRVVSCVASCASMGASPSADTVKRDSNRRNVIECFSLLGFARHLAALYEYIPHPGETQGIVSNKLITRLISTK